MACAGRRDGQARLGAGRMFRDCRIAEAKCGRPRREAHELHDWMRALRTDESAAGARNSGGRRAEGF